MFDAVTIATIQCSWRNVMVVQRLAASHCCGVIWSYRQSPMDCRVLFAMRSARCAGISVSANWRTCREKMFGHLL